MMYLFEGMTKTLYILADYNYDLGAYVWEHVNTFSLTIDM